MTLLPIDTNMQPIEYVCATSDEGLARQVCGELNKIGTGSEKYPFAQIVSLKLEGSKERNMFAINVRIVFSTKADIRKVEFKKLMKKWEQATQKYKKYDWDDQLRAI